MPGSDFSGFPSGGRLAVITPKDETVLPGNVSVGSRLSLGVNTLIAFPGTGAISTIAGVAFGDTIGISGGLTCTGNISVGTGGAYTWSGADLLIGRIAAASLRIGGGNNATPIAQTFTLGESSRAGTDSNVAGASGTIQPGLGTGIGTPAPIILSAPVTVASGTGAQTYSEGMRVQGVGTLPGLGFFGSAAAVKPTITGSRATAAAIASLLTELATLGLITDGSSA